MSKSYVVVVALGATISRTALAATVPDVVRFVIRMLFCEKPVIEIHVAAKSKSFFIVLKYKKPRHRARAFLDKRIIL